MQKVAAGLFITMDGVIEKLGNWQETFDEDMGASMQTMLADSTADWPPIPAQVHVYMPHVDATYQRALEAGASPVQEPVKHNGEDDKRGGVRDAGGITWWMATHEQS
jgi:uncharacterized glyoxalase superfamily protein PhnB